MIQRRFDLTSSYRKLNLAAVTLIATLLFVASAMAGKAHEHGIGQINVAIEGATLEIELELPAHDVVGFEKAPKTDAQKKKAEASKAFLLSGKFLEVNTEASCVLKKAEVEGVVFGGAPAKDGHSDVEASFQYDCSQSTALKTARVLWTESLKALGKIKYQFVRGSSQRTGVLTKKENVINLEP